MLTSAAVGQLEDDELSLLLPWHGLVFRHNHVIWELCGPFVDPTEKYSSTS